MFPSRTHPFYGIFVRTFVKNFDQTNINIIAASLISGRGKDFLQKLKKYFKFYISIISNLIQYKYDIIYVHYPSYASLPILLCLPFVSKPIILNFHGTDILSSAKLSIFFKFLLKPIIKKSHTIVVPSHYFKHLVAKQLGVKKKKIFVSPSGGIDTSIFKPSFEPTNNSSFILGYAGRIDEGKGWDVFLNAFAIMKDTIPDLKCKLAGSGSQTRELKELINKLNISESAIYIGPVPHQKLASFYNSLDLFIFPTELKESLGLVGIEALACGVPVIASKIGGLTDYIVEGKNGVFFEPGNPQDLAKKILELYQNTSLSSKLKSTARMSIATYDKKIVSIKMTEKLEQISKIK